MLRIPSSTISVSLADLDFTLRRMAAREMVLEASLSSFYPSSSHISPTYPMSILTNYSPDPLPAYPYYDINQASLLNRFVRLTPEGIMYVSPETTDNSSSSRHHSVSVCPYLHQDHFDHERQSHHPVAEPVKMLISSPYNSTTNPPQSQISNLVTSTLHTVNNPTIATSRPNVAPNSSSGSETMDSAALLSESGSDFDLADFSSACNIHSKITASNLPPKLIRSTCPDFEETFSHSPQSPLPPHSPSSSALSSLSSSDLLNIPTNPVTTTNSQSTSEKLASPSQSTGSPYNATKIPHDSPHSENPTQLYIVKNPPSPPSTVKYTALDQSLPNYYATYDGTSVDEYPESATNNSILESSNSQTISFHKNESDDNATGDIHQVSPPPPQLDIGPELELPLRPASHLSAKKIINPRSDISESCKLFNTHVKSSDTIVSPKSRDFSVCSVDDFSCTDTTKPLKPANSLDKPSSFSAFNSLPTLSTELLSHASHIPHSRKVLATHSYFTPVSPLPRLPEFSVRQSFPFLVNDHVNPLSSPANTAPHALPLNNATEASFPPSNTAWHQHTQSARGARHRGFQSENVSGPFAPYPRTGFDLASPRRLNPQPRSYDLDTTTNATTLTSRPTRFDREARRVTRTQ